MRSSLFDQPATRRCYRVVNPDTGECWGYFADEDTAHRIADDFAHLGAVVQYQQAPTVHPWTTLPEETT